LTANSHYNQSSFFFFFSSSTDGAIIVNGIMDFSHLLHPVTDVRIDLKNFYANYYKQSIEVLLNADNIRVTGRDTLLMTGDLKVAQGDWNFDYEDNLKTSYINEQNLSNTRVLMDFRIQLVDNFRVHYTDPNGIGSFDMYMETPIGEYFYWKTDADGKPETRGIIEIDNGSFTNYKTFDIEQGIINFNKKDRDQNWFNPWVDFKATREEDEYTFKVLFNDFLTRLSEFKLQVYDENLEQLTLSDQQRFNLLIFGQKDLNNFNLRNVVTNVTFLLANSRFFNALGIENLEINDAAQNNNNNQENVQTTPSVKVKTKLIPLVGNLRTRVEVNSSARGLGFEYIGLIYKLSDHFRIDLSRDEGDIFNQQATDLQENYNLRLKWYYEF
ncbi:MAG: hypothetical protein KDD94_03975, partial [Calditrichaeota bacterium]|nr:hypothetical protein [Calditrichota bacterium]